MGNAAKPVILVTGASGLIGSELCKSFAPEFQLVGLDRKPPKVEVAGSDFVACDLTKDASMAEALRIVREKYGDRLASVIHLAAYYDFSGEPSPLYRDLTVEGTRRLLRELQAFQVGQFVFSSTLLVMKPVEHKDEILTEDSPLQGEWDYPRSKIEAEKVLTRERGAIPVVILRIAGVYDGDCHSVPISQQISRIYNQDFESHLFPGDPSHGQPFVHMEDLVECFQKTVEHRHKLDPVEIFLIAEPDTLSYAELQDRLGELIHGKEWRTIRFPKPLAKAGAWLKDRLTPAEAFIKPWMIDLADQHYPVEIARAKQRLDWNPRHRLRDGLTEMVDSLKRDPKRWHEMNKLPLPKELQPAS
jgi:nucleoside-diphosphate-sugar epimerase